MTFQLLWLTLLGLCVGSFITVLIHRIPTSIVYSAPMNLIGPRSECPHCGNTIPWYDNIPLLSWCLLQGKCRHCKSGISPMYPLAELTTGITFLVLGLRLPAGDLLAAAIFFSCVLITLAVIDMRHQLLPDILTITLLWAGMLLSSACIIPTELQSSVAGAAIGYLLLRVIRDGFLTFRKKEALGLGDAKLLAAIGAWAGAESIAETVFWASVCGISYLVTAKILSGRSFQAAMPFGPCLALAGSYSFFTRLVA